MTAQEFVLEVFAGAGGISEALRIALPRASVLGIETDADACATAMAAGHARLRADASMLDLRPWVGRVVGLCMGPPCQSYSQAGRQLGKLDRPRIEAHIERIRKAGRWLHYSREGWHDPRSPLVLEVLRYALTLRPEWIVLEQVPQVLPLWVLMGEVLREQGWTVATGLLKAEQYAVAQTRKRAILAASMRVVATLPAPTHRHYRKGLDRDAGDQSLAPWVSMGDVLGIDAGGVSLRSNYGTGGDPANRGSRELGEPAPTVTSKVGRNLWLRQSAVRAIEEPAPTITAGHDSAERVWVAGEAVRFGNQDHSAVRLISEPAATVRFPQRMNACDWLPGPGRVSVREAGLFQSFRGDYPWQGSPSAQYRQVGDAAPPLLMAPVIKELTRR